ncbi:MAG: U32 family peptidase, partial [Proteobacteria bacterium]|nr:U32 family peptidase [Pseudomonadota bacterium]
VAEAFRAVLDGRLEPDAALERLAGLAPFAPFINGFYHGAEGAARIGADP